MKINQVLLLPEFEEKLLSKHEVHNENTMENENNLTSISKSRTVEEMIAFWDAHSTAEFDDQTTEVDLEFDSSARLNRIAIEPVLMQELWQIADRLRVGVETLINVWLRQYVDDLRKTHKIVEPVAIAV